MKTFALARSARAQNWEMAFAFGFPVGAGLFASVYFGEGGLLLASVVGCVALLTLSGAVLFLMRPIPGTLSLDGRGLHLIAGAVRAQFSPEEIEFSSAQWVRGPLPTTASWQVVTRPDRVVRLRMRDGRELLVSPEDPAAFVQACQKYVVTEAVVA